MYIFCRCMYIYLFHWCWTTCKLYGSCETSAMHSRSSRRTCLIIYIVLNDLHLSKYPYIFVSTNIYITSWVASDRHVDVSTGRKSWRARKNFTSKSAYCWARGYSSLEPGNSKLVTNNTKITLTIHMYHWQ